MRKKVYYDEYGNKITEKLVDGIKVTIKGEITEDAQRAYSERLAIILYNKYGQKNCEKLLELLSERR